MYGNITHCASGTGNVFEVQSVFTKLCFVWSYGYGQLWPKEWLQWRGTGCREDRHMDGWRQYVMQWQRKTGRRTKECVQENDDWGSEDVGDVYVTYLLHEAESFLRN